MATQQTEHPLVVTKRLELHSSPDRVWEAISDPAQIVQWFPDVVDIAAMKPGNRGYFVWNDHGRYAFEIELFEPRHRIAWRWARDADVELDETPTTLVTFEISPGKNGGTVLDLEETGFGTELLREGNDRGWDKELGELVDYLAD